MVRIIPVESVDAIREASLLFQEYAASLGVDLSFQDFNQEIASLPGDYAPPHGRLFLAFVSGEIAGCAALRKSDGDSGEMKRLYVRASFRGQGVGRSLAQAVIDAACTIGYRRVRLDTLPDMRKAQELYRSLGFCEIPPYRYNPVPGTKFFELIL